MTLLIFDCDDVLVDSEVLVTDAHVAALRQRGIAITHVDLAERYLGVTDAAMYADLQQRHGRPLPDGYDAAVKAEVIRRSAQELAAISGARETVAALSFPCCVASSSSEALLHHKLAVTDLSDLLGGAIFSADAVARGKPAPDVFLYAAAQMRVAPQECVVVEDSENGACRDRRWHARNRLHRRRTHWAGA